MPVTIIKPVQGQNNGTWGTDLNAYLDAVKIGVNVKEYSAVGDGITDDTASLNLAIATGKPVYVPAGTYRLTSAITIPAQCIITGDGRPSSDSTSKVIFYADHAGDGFVIDNTGTDQIHLSGFMITKSGSTHTGTGKGIKIYTSTNINGTGRQLFNIKISYFDAGLYLHATIMDSFEKMRINNCTTYGIRLYGDTSVTAPHDCSFKNIWLQTNPTAIYFDGYNNQHTFEHIKIMYSATRPINTGTTELGRITFRGLMFEANTGTGSADLINILSGKNWLFSEVYHADTVTTPLFSSTTDADTASITVKNSWIPLIGKGKKVQLENLSQYGDDQLAENWSSGINITQKNDNIYIRSPHISSGSVYGESIITPAIQAGIIKTQYISAAGQALDNVAWTKSNLTVTTGQVDPYGGTTAYKLTRTAAGLGSEFLSVAYGSSPAAKTFVFQVWAKPVSTTDGDFLLDFQNSATVTKSSMFHLDRDEWTLCYITIRPILATPTSFSCYFSIPTTNTNGIYLSEPCFYESEVPLIFQNTGDTYTASSFCVREFGNQKKFSGELLLSSTTVALNANADTTIYTVPTGKRCVLTKAILVAGADAGASTTIAIGQNTAETDFIPANTLSNLDAQYDSVILLPIPNTIPLKNKSYAAGTVIQAQVGAQSGGATNTLYLFGILY